MNRWLAPWIAALRIARRQALRAKGRTALSAVMVGLPLFVLTAGSVVLTSAMPTEATQVRLALGDSAQARVTPEPGCVPLAEVPNGFQPGMCGLTVDEQGIEVSEGTALAPDEMESLVRSLVPGATLETAWSSEARLTMPGARNNPLTVRTIDASGPLASTVLVLDGAVPTRPGEIGLKSAHAAKLGISIGDQIDLEVDDRTIPVTVTALLSGSEAFVVAAPGTVPVEGAAPTWYVLGEEPLTWDDAVVLNNAGMGVVSRHVLDNPPARADVPYYVLESQWGSQDSRLTAQIGLIAALIVLEVVLLVGPAFAVGARRQARSLALVAATGGTRRDLRRIVLANGVVVGAVASALAVGIGVLAAAAAVHWPYPDPYVVFPNLVIPPYVAGLVAVGTLIAVLAAWIPARHAARVDVVAALAGRRAEARPRAGLGTAGLLVAGLGVPLGVYGGYSGSSALAGGGGILVVLGLVAASGLLISAAGRLARRTGVATRIALRDLARQRGRTAPAVAAVLGAIAAATAGAVHTAAGAEHALATWLPETDLGTVKVRLVSWEGGVTIPEHRIPEVADAIHGIDPGAQVATLHAGLPVEPPDPDSWWSISASEDESRICPLYLMDQPSAEDRAEHADDPRCKQDSGAYWGSHFLWPSSENADGVIVDDGSALALITGESSPGIVSALAEGRVVVPYHASLWHDGTVRLMLDEDMGPRAVGTVPGAFVETRLGVAGSLMLPPTALDALDLELDVAPFAVVAKPSALWSAAQVTALKNAIAAIDPGTPVDVEAAPERDVSLTVLAFVGGASFLALAATWIASGLAAVESRADLATLAAVGAAPRVRRRVAGLQSGFLTLTGLVPGMLGGLAVGWALVSASAGLGTEYPDPTWRMVVPWQILLLALVALPVVAGAATAVFTPSRLPLVRRTAE